MIQEVYPKRFLDIIDNLEEIKRGGCDIQKEYPYFFNKYVKEIKEKKLIEKCLDQKSAKRLCAKHKIPTR